jgi:hypothetical protein
MHVLYRSPIDGAVILADGSTRSRWRKSTYSADTANCVETARVPDGMLVRDSKDPDDGLVLAFIDDVKAGRLG